MEHSINIHAGIDIWRCHAKAIYVKDGVQKEHDFNGSKTDVTNLEKMVTFFQNLKSKNDAKLDCVCFITPYENEEGSKKFENFSNYHLGFKNVQTIPVDKAIYYEARLSCKLKKSDIVWIFLNEMDKICVWKDDKFVAETKYNQQESEKSKLDVLNKLQGPPAVMYVKKSFRDKKMIKMAYPTTVFVEFKEDDYSNMALTYAQIMAGEIILNDNVNRNTSVHRNNQNTTVNINFSASLPQTENMSTHENAEGISKFVQYFNLTLSKFKNISNSENEKLYTLPKKIEINNDKINAVGIDLGTSRCCAAVNRNNGIDTVALDNDGQRLLPSFIAYDEAHVKCGQIVVNRLRNYARSSVFDSKRIIGREFNDIEIEEIWPFSVISDNDKVMLEVNTFNGKNLISPESASASLLKHIKEKVEEFQGQKLYEAVITVPAAFTEEQKNATLKAAKLAGWEKVELLPEPVAASFASFINKPISNYSKILLFDLGGGTLDVCIFKIQNNNINIISNTGDSKLGGRDFDKILFNYFLNILNSKYGISLESNKKYKLMKNCQDIKESLSSATNSTLYADEFDASKNEEQIKVSQEEFQTMTKTLMNRIQNTINSALQTSGYKHDQIDKILLVGGGSRMPMIRNLLQRIFPRCELCCEQNPDEVVAIGAAYYAYNILTN